jgi:glycine/D-amino acid oxidase-like deaminating enzyme
MKDFLISKESFLVVELKIEDLKLEKDFVRWNNLESKKIIFCEGFSMTENTFFNWIPFSPVKGETITVSIPGFPETHIVNKDVFILPLGENLFKVGATFDYDLKPGVTNKGRNELVEKLQKLIQVPFQVVDQQAGIRPASKDRRPLIGLHPNLKMIGLFNGLGTKGVSLAPYFADQFADFLDGKEELDPDVNIQRYYSLYYDLK